VKRVLVTGATGFIGRHAAGPLERRGFDVHGISSRTADLLEPGEAERVLEEVRPTHLLHLAWYSVHREYWTSPENRRWVEASLRLVKRFRELGGERVVVAGSCAEYDWSAGVCVERETPLAPRGLYGESKNALREALGEDDVAWGRIFFLYGPCEHPERLVPSVVRPLLDGEEAHVSEGSQVRDFLHVADVADAFAGLVDSDVTGPVNVASGEGRSVRDVVETAARTVGRPELVRFGAPVDEEPLVVADVTRLRDEVGWSRARSLEQGLAETVEWWRTQT
jgi:nucleoside-diphosphate-sugar epimerase